jgi:hypothetical protein
MPLISDSADVRSVGNKQVLAVAGSSGLEHHIETIRRH